MNINNERGGVMNDLLNHNVLFITLDSCRFDTMINASTPNMDRIGRFRKAFTYGSYTVPAHTAFFAGHLPNTFSYIPFYTESKKRLWRIKTGRSFEILKAELEFEASNIIQGYKDLGFYVLGVGGVTQFNRGSLLRSYFGKDFLYYGPSLDEEPLEPRSFRFFPLNHVDEIIKKIDKHEKWFLFMNCPETHYPYDVGCGISNDVLSVFPEAKKILNLREGNVDYSLVCINFFQSLYQMQIHALEIIDQGIGRLVNALPKNRDILVIICGDHGENFGEVFEGKIRWGHLFPSKQVMEVPLIIGQIRRV